ncbi:MAG TPA: N-formylglutamate amidohydrolase [Burkholderiaceae bacterium]|nr:N-formylglutamate amidohydrolase [Burkholderiaceae bacterium]
MHFTESAFPAYGLTRPAGPALPLIADSPHSGTTYPADFDVCIPMGILRTAEDTYVDELWSAIPDVGGTLLSANFPRTYIDANRDVTDIDPGLLAEPWPDTLMPTEKSTLMGHGLLWKNVRDTPIYDRKLWVGEVLNRIGTYYQPYHHTLREQLDAAHAEFGCVWHLNLHSMPSDTFELLGVAPSERLADFVLGDLDGTSCDPTLTGIVEDFLTEAGYTVARNLPFKGATLVEQHGKPAARRNSLQIEINRKLYMNESSFEKNADFDRLKASLDDLCLHIAQFIREML